MVREGHRIDVVGLTKRFGAVTAVDDLSFSCSPGGSPASSGPTAPARPPRCAACSGWSTPTSGTATIGGRYYRDLPHPWRAVGAALEAASFHPARTARNHLRVMAAPPG